MDLDSVRFFTVELRNGHVMSTPKYEPAQEFVGSLIHEVSLKGPEFAWIQFVFRNLDYHPQLVSLKAELSYYKKYADTPETKTDGEGRDYTVERKEKGTEWYRSIQEKVKKIDAVESRPTISMAIRGMWVGDVDALGGLSAFSNCSDELDRLAVVPAARPKDARLAGKEKGARGPSGVSLALRDKGQEGFPRAHSNDGRPSVLRPAPGREEVRSHAQGSAAVRRIVHCKEGDGRKTKGFRSSGRTRGRRSGRPRRGPEGGVHSRAGGARRAVERGRGGRTQARLLERYQELRGRLRQELEASRPSCSSRPEPTQTCSGSRSN